MRIGELSLGDDFDGVLHWGLIDNRPFLRCIHSYGLCLWRLGHFDDADRVFERMLWLNPSDNQGVRFLIDDALNRNEFQEAERWLEKTFSSLLERKRKGKWYPELSLLMDQLEYYMEEGQEEIAALLLVWSEVSLKLGDTQRGTAAQLQGVIFRLPDDCEAVIKEYNRIIGPKTRKTVDPLFEQWHWLARLTSDLPDSKRLVQKYPVFYKTALPAEASADDLLGSFRCSGLKKMNAGPGLLVAMDVWKEYLHLIVPNPVK